MQSTTARSGSLPCFIRLVGMRRRAGASLPASLAWAAGLLWRAHGSRT